MEFRDPSMLSFPVASLILFDMASENVSLMVIESWCIKADLFHQSLLEIECPTLDDFSPFPVEPG